VEKHYVAMRSRSQPAVLVFLAQDAEAHTFCYSNGDIRKGEERGELMRFIEFWQELHHDPPPELVFDSQLTTYEHLAQIHDLGITFITLRRRSPRLLREIALLKPSAWRTVELDVPTRKYRTPRVYEQQGIFSTSWGRRGEAAPSPGGRFARCTSWTWGMTSPRFC